MFVTDRDGAYREILCVQEQRVVANDNTVSWNGRYLQIPESPLRRHFVKATVRVHEYPDGTASIFLGPHRLAQFTAEGTPIVAAPTNPSLAPCSEPSRTSPKGRAKSASLTAPARVAHDNARVGTWRNRGVTTAGTGWPPRNAKGARPCPRASTMSASMYH